jgi:hypothetical protein
LSFANSDHPKRNSQSRFWLQSVALSFFVQFSDSFQIEDFYCYGLRRSDSSDVISSLPEDDCIYFSLSYGISKISLLYPTVQIQLKYIDPSGVTLINFFNLSFTLDNNKPDVYKNVYFVTLFAASLHRAIQCRFELNSKDEAIQLLSQLNPGNRKDPEIRLLYYVLPEKRTSITSHKFFSGGFLLNYELNRPSSVNRQKRSHV